MHPIRVTLKKQDQWKRTDASRVEDATWKICFADCMGWLQVMCQKKSSWPNQVLGRTITHGCYVPVLLKKKCVVGGLEHFLCFNILGSSSSQLIFIFFRGVGIPPTRYVFCLWRWRSLKGESPTEWAPEVAPGDCCGSRLLTLIRASFWDT